MNIHAGCVTIDGKGVLLLGESGAGKSFLALRLMDGGARLVADDRCDVFVRAGKLCAAPPRAIAGLMELRGIGIVALPYVKRVRLAMAVRLMRNPPRTRLPAPVFYPPPAPLQAASIPLIVVNGESAAAPALVRAALAAFSRKAFRDTFNPD